MNVERQWLRAQQYIASNQITAARIALEALVQRAPDHAAAHMLLASAILSEGRVREAAAHAILAAKAPLQDAEAVSATAHCLLRLGEITSARDCLEGFDSSRVADGHQLTMLAHAHQKLGDHPGALSLMDRALAHDRNNADFHYFRGLQLQFNGRIDEARTELETCLRLGPTYGRAVLTLVRMREQTSEFNQLDYVRRQLRDVERGSEDHAALEFAQFEILEDLGRYDEAFAALRRGNVIMYARSRHDIARDEKLFDALIAATPADSLRAGATELPGPRPIFVVGLPRSGTTLLDRILDNHSRVISTGERNDFPRQLRWVADRHGHELLDEGLIGQFGDINCAELGRRYLAQTQWRAQGRPYYIDKLPPNYLLVGLIHRALPDAPILHMVREPMDACFSNFKAMFGDTHAYSYSLDALAARYRQYRRLMQHWHAALPGRVHDVNYRDLVADPDPVIRRILEYCRLPYEPGCAEFKRNKTAVDTLSSAQVREPIHRRSLGEWMRYATQLESLRAALAA